MVQFFKHLAVRVWTALFLSALATLVLLPPFAGVFGPSWLVVPGVVLFVVAFWLIGMVFAALGRHRLERLIDEAKVWERAGMDREARQALVRAETTVDSFFFSPLSVKQPAKRLLASVARFQLAFGAPETTSDAVIEDYLRRFPRDRDAAAKWLERVLAGRAVTRKTHDIASRIGAAHPEDNGIQRLLAQFYLNERRCDFSALQTYRQVIESGDSLPPELGGGIADLFLAQQRADALALMVYLDRYEHEGRDRRLLPGIAGCVRMIHPSTLTRPLLDRAETLLANIDPPRRREMADLFLPDEDTAHGYRSRHRPSGPRKAILPSIAAAMVQTARGFRHVLNPIGFGFGWCLAAAGGAGRGLGRLLAARRTRTVIKWGVLGMFVIAVGWLIASTVSHFESEIQPTAAPPEPVAVPVTDPFTLQVAAYLKSADAQRFVDELKAHGLDAYRTRASGGNRTWYQVRVSHFKTKADARAYGEELKKRRLIDDYYVANYKQGQ